MEKLHFLWFLFPLFKNCTCGGKHAYCTKSITNTYVNGNHTDLIQCREENEH